jgi:sigma-B regulation protein RsbU (phosphoserine phosphatase)
VSRPRILVVDDDAGMLRAAERVLGTQYDVQCCQSSRDALARVAAFEPDVALLDVRMPELSGFQLREALRDLCPGLDVIFMTGSLDHFDATFIRAIRAHAFYFVQKPFDRDVLLTLMERCLELRRLSAENRRHMSRLETELAAARTFQQSLLPAASAQVEGIAIDARYVPCTELGGDLYDYAAAGPGRATMLIADVAGHGVRAAMLTGVVKAAFDASHADEYEPRAIIRRIAEGVRRFELTRFVTAVCARIDAAQGTLEYVNAGHPGGMMWSAAGDRILRLDSTGPFASSAFPDARWEQPVLDCRVGDAVLLFTDGLSERWQGDESFGEERIQDEIGCHRHGGGALLDALIDASQQFTDDDAEASDDLTLITARRLPVVPS